MRMSNNIKLNATQITAWTVSLDLQCRFPHRWPGLIFLHQVGYVKSMSIMRISHVGPFHYFSIATQIQLKLCFVAIQICTILSLQMFAHATTALLSWHVQKFVVILQFLFGRKSWVFQCHQTQWEWHPLLAMVSRCDTARMSCGSL